MINKPSKASYSGKQVTQLQDIYPNIVNIQENYHVERFQDISKRYAKSFGEEPQFFVRVPGVVTLFGEDYNYGGYSQLQFCTEQDVVIAFRKSQKSEIVIQNSLNSVFPEQRLPLDPNQKLSDSDEYHNAILIGYKAALFEAQIEEKNLLGISMHVDINLTNKQQLKKTNALSLAVALLTLDVYNLKDKAPGNLETLIQNIAKYKKIILPQTAFSKDWDQRSALSCSKQSVYFFRSRKELEEADEIPAPQKACFIIANSLSRSDTHIMTQGKRADKRAIEIQIGLFLMLKKLDLHKNQNIQTLFDLQCLMQYTTEDMIHHIEQNIQNAEQTSQELEKILENSLQSLLSKVPYSEVVLANNKSYNPYKILMHILNETLRAEKIAQLFLQNAPSTDEQEVFQTLAETMNDSHQSINENLGVKSEEIDKLAQLLKAYGCMGIKTIGSGWSGSVIALVNTNLADGIISQIYEEYYLNQENKLMIGDDLSTYIYKTHIAPGAMLLDPQYEIWF